jgi:hypothetical protein
MVFILGQLAKQPVGNPNGPLYQKRTTENTMKRFAMLATVLVGALALSGCIQLHSDTVIDEDGSGTASLTMSVSTDVAEAIQEMQAMDSEQSQEFPMFDEITQDEIAEAGKDHGVKIKKFEKKEADGHQSLEMVLDFEDLKGLSYVMGKVMGGEMGGGFGIYDAGDGNFVLKSAQYDFPAEPAEEEEEAEEEVPAEADPEQMQKQMELAGKLMAAISELDVSFKITVPGEIVESNAPTVEGNTSIWAVDSSNMMQQDQNMDPEIVFSGKGLKIEPLTE